MPLPVLVGLIIMTVRSAIGLQASKWAGQGREAGRRAARSAPARRRGRRVQELAWEPVLSPRPLGAFGPVNCRRGRFRSAGRHAGALQGEARGSAAGGGDAAGWVRDAPVPYRASWPEPVRGGGCSGPWPSAEVRAGGVRWGARWGVSLGSPGAEAEGGPSTVGREAAVCAGHLWSL